MGARARGRSTSSGFGGCFGGRTYALWVGGWVSSPPGAEVLAFKPALQCLYEFPFLPTQVGAGIATAIAIHNIPEGICVAMPIYYATGNKWKVCGWRPCLPGH